MFRKSRQPSPRIDPEHPPVPVLSEGEVLWSIDNVTHLPIKVVAYVTKTAEQDREEVAKWADEDYLATRTFSDEMIYKQPNGRWITSSRHYMTKDKAGAVLRARRELAEAYALLNARRVEIDVIEEMF